ncbi:MAG: dTDP-glucose 4,6-dehydratase [Candidatus Aegiribacteria sp.]|nr:dTDP-glucose 4,6-dehydratase [Candidatus Aegiribacteria sp.]MBD3294761.1 dTDP-glucose 4,6-dehydratase [Candidatus Fermentibacteria bacterium]
MKILVTGGAGFIGSNFTRMVMEKKPEWSVTVLDKLTYAGRRENLAHLESSSRFHFIKGDICSAEAVTEAMDGCDMVVNFAAETHVDRSIQDSSSFVDTDVEGVRVLLEVFRESKRKLFLQISTDEVYGSVEEGRSSESDPLAPRSPYAASKAGGELLAMSYWTTYGVPVVVTRASNNYGPYQYPEKLIPLFVTNAMDGQPLPLYGDGLNRRDWLYVEDHCRALMQILELAKPGNVYNIGAGQELSNREVTDAILQATGAGSDLIRYVEDRPGHDRRYALDVNLVERDIGWKAETDFSSGLVKTVEWYRLNRDWWETIKSGEFREYYTKMYSRRLKDSKGSE